MSAYRLGTSGGSSPGVLLGMIAVSVAVLVAVPFGFVLWSVAQMGGTSLYLLILRPRIGELLLDTAWLLICALPPSIVLGVLMAWTTERTNVPARRFLRWVAVLPLAVPAFVHGYAWISLFPSMAGLSAATLLSVLAYYPFLYLPIASQLRRLDPAHEEVAATLGLSPTRVFARVVLPQLRYSICGGSLLVALHLLAEYGLYATIRFDTFTTAIVDQFQSSFDGPAAIAISAVLVGCCALAIGLESVVRGGERYARVGRGAAREPTGHELGAGTRLGCLLLHLGVAAAAVGVPALTLTRWSRSGGIAGWFSPDMTQAFGTTVLLGIAGGALATIAAMPSAWLSIRSPGRLSRLLEAVHYYAGSLPGVVVALSLVAVTVRVAMPLYQTTATLLAAYACMFLPRALVALRPSLAQVPVALEEAAQSLGRSRPAAIALTMRLAAPGMSASVALVALGIVTELTGTLMLAPNGTETLATRFWVLTSELDYGAAAPYAILMVLSSLPLTILTVAGGRR